MLKMIPLEPVKGNELIGMILHKMRIMTLMISLVRVNQGGIEPCKTLKWGKSGIIGFNRNHKIHLKNSFNDYCSCIAVAVRLHEWANRHASERCTAPWTMRRQSWKPQTDQDLQNNNVQNKVQHTKPYAPAANRSYVWFPLAHNVLHH